MNPKIIRRGGLKIAGVSCAGDNALEAWNAFEALSREKPLENKLSENGYEIRFNEGDACTVHVGFAVSEGKLDPAYEEVELPAAQYASFDVYVANGYDSENSAMDAWLKTNGQGYSERLLGEKHYCVEYYDERFNGNEAGSVIEIWIPVEKR